VDPLEPIRELVARVAELSAEFEKVRAERDAALELAGTLARRVAELERAVGSGRGGGHNGPPPKRPPSSRPRGGQTGRKGKAASKPEVVDDTQDHHLHACPRCSGAVSPREGVRERFEFEAVERALRTVRHILHEAWCPRCKRKVRPQAPLALPGSSYGPRAHSELASLRATMGCTIGDLETFTRTLWHRALSGGQIVVMLDRTAAALVATFWWIVEQLTHEPAINQDTTSWRFEGERAVLWVFTSRRLTAYWIDSDGTQAVPRVVLGAKIDGYVGSDGAERFQLVDHAGEQRCIAHSLREARELLAAHPECEELVSMMSELRDRLSRIIGFYKRRAQLAASTWLHYLSRERAALRRLAARGWTDADCLRMAKRIRRDLGAWLMFMTVPPEQELEPTNNRAERGLRPVVIDRKRMQQSRGLGGVFREVILRSVAATCKSLGVSFEAVASEALLARARAGPSGGASVSPILVRALNVARAQVRAPTSAPVAMGV
jgi:hypothetical protein